MAPGETPLSLYSKIADQQNNFLFESVEVETGGLNIQLLDLAALTRLKFLKKVIETMIDESRIPMKLKIFSKKLKQLSQNIARPTLKIYQDFMEVI